MQGIEDEIQMAKPADLGGMKSEAYLALNPEGKMPLLVTPEGEGIFESKVSSNRAKALVCLSLHSQLFTVCQKVAHPPQCDSGRERG